MARNGLLCLIFIGFGVFSDVISLSNIWAQAPKKPQIAFGRKVKGLHWKIYLMDIDGKNVRLLTKGIAKEGWPSWSPDGRQIVFRSTRAGGGIYVMDANGRNIRRLTFFEEDQHPAWSPEGKKIAFISLRDPIPKVYVMDADGRNQRRLTHDHVPEASPAWFDPRFARAVAPVGKRLLTWGWLKQLEW